MKFRVNIFTLQQLFYFDYLVLWFHIISRHDENDENNNKKKKKIAESSTN